MDVVEKAKAARDASIHLAGAEERVKNEALEAMADAIDKNREIIKEKNKIDIDEGEKLRAEGKLTKALVDRLKLSDSKIDTIVESIRSVKDLDDPVGKVLSKTELDEGLVLSKETVPIGVIGTVFESRPDVVPQIASLCLKTGNSMIFKGGSEAAESNRILYEIIKESTEEVLIDKGWIQMIETRNEVSKILELDEYISLMIPRGSNQFVKHIMDNTRIPVLGHADGICHVYVDEKADIDKAIGIVVDSKTQYPAVCNAMETLLVSEKIAKEFLPKVCESLRGKEVELRGDEKTQKIVKVKKATENDWSTEYNDLILSIKVVEGIMGAIGHINNYGSHHTDSIVTEDQKNADFFIKQVDSACVFHNCSTRFSDGFRFGLGAEVGISTNKIHARGPVGLEGLVIYRYVLRGNGQVVADYVGPKARKFSHRKLKRILS